MDTQRVIEKAFREESGAVLAALIRHIGDFSRAEEALQEAFVSALETWSPERMPENPGAWLMTTARRRAIDSLRRSQTVHSKSVELAALLSLEAEESRDRMSSDSQEVVISDDVLRLIFCCCNPALAQEAQVALTLRTVCGLTTSEIAKSFLVSEVTMAQRLVRAKKKIRAAKIPFQVPSNEDLPDRVDSVLAVIYLIFNEGYFSSSEASLVRGDLCGEALHLIRTLRKMAMDSAELNGLLALVLLQNSRSRARVSSGGDLILLADQDRSLWNRDFIAEGQAIIRQTLGKGGLGPYQVQAAIAAIHSEAEEPADTDWQQIVALYGELRKLGDSPVIQLNQIVAISMVQGPADGLHRLEPLSEALAEYQSYHAARADFLRQLGRTEEAAAAYGEALHFCANPIVARYYRQQMNTGINADKR